MATQHWSAVADVYIDMAQADEIHISNTQLNPKFTLKIHENADKMPLSAKIDWRLNTQKTGKNTARHAADSININRLPFHQEVLQAANVTALDPALIHAVIAVESKHNAQAKSQKGAYGLMQLMPATAQRFQVKDKTNTAQNILAGAQYLRELLTLFNGDLQLTLAAYNAGPGAVQKYQNRVPPYRETMHYVPKVLQYYRQYS